MNDLAPISALILLPMIVFYMAFRDNEMVLVGAALGMSFAADAGYVPSWTIYLLILGVAYLLVQDVAPRVASRL
jgi:hypothetical protein